MTRLGDRAGEAGRVDVRGDLAGLARLDDLVEVGDGAAAARLGGDDLQVGVARVLHDERPVELVALRNRAVILDRLDDGEARGFLRFLRGFSLLGLGARGLFRLGRLIGGQRMAAVSATRTAIMTTRIRFDDMRKILLCWTT